MEGALGSVCKKRNSACTGWNVWKSPHPSTYWFLRGQKGSRAKMAAAAVKAAGVFWKPAMGGFFIYFSSRRWRNPPSPLAYTVAPFPPLPTEPDWVERRSIHPFLSNSAAARVKEKGEWKTSGLISRWGGDQAGTSQKLGKQQESPSWSKQDGGFRGCYERHS